MANKDKKVSISMMDRVLKSAGHETKTVVVPAGDGTVELTVKAFVPLAEYAEMVNEVASSVFVVHDATGEEQYVPALYSAALSACILCHVANFKDEAGAQRMFELGFCPEVMHSIYTVWDPEQREQFVSAVKEQIEWKKQHILCGERAKLTQISAQLTSTAEAMEQVSSLFAGADGELMLKVFQNLSTMDEHQLGKAVIDARDPDFVNQRRARLEVIK